MAIGDGVAVSAEARTHAGNVMAREHVVEGGIIQGGKLHAEQPDGRDVQGGDKVLEERLRS
jgi:hypothetical protein